MLLDELLQERRRQSEIVSAGRAPDIEEQAGLPRPLASLRRRQRPAFERRLIKDHRSIGVSKIAKRALPISCLGQLYDGVAFRNRAILRIAAFRAPTPAGKS